MTQRAYIKAISWYLPERVLDNEALVAQFPEWSVAKVAKKVGVDRRHMVADDETALDLAEKACRKLFAEHAVSPQDVDFILLCTQSPDYHLPTSACLLQNRLEIPTHAGALDFNLGCSGFVYGLSLAKGLIATATARNVLLVTAETYTKYIHPADKGNRSIFGDGAAATLISTSGMAEIGNFALGTDGSGAQNLIVRTGGARHPQPQAIQSCDETGTVVSSDHLYMNGGEIFNFTLDTVPALTERVLAANGMSAEDIDYTIFHQANKFMLDTLRTVCSISKDKYYNDLSDTGNTVSSTIPIALSRAIKKGLVHEGMNVVIAGFGVGYSYGATVLKF